MILELLEQPLLRLFKKNVSRLPRGIKFESDGFGRKAFLDQNLVGRQQRIERGRPNCLLGKQVQPGLLFDGGLEGPARVQPTPLASASAVCQAEPKWSCQTETSVGTPLPSTKASRTVTPMVRGAIKITSMLAGGTMPWNRRL